MKDLRIIESMLALALGSEERCREAIDKTYYKDEAKYLQIIADYGIDTRTFFKKAPYLDSNYVKKALSIVLDETHNDRYLLLHSLIKKGYKDVYTYYQHNNYIILEQFTAWYEVKKNGFQHISGIYLDYCYFVLVYLALTGDKSLAQTDRLAGTQERAEDIFQLIPFNVLKEEINENLVNEDYKGVLDRITYKDAKITDVSLLFENIKLKEEGDLLGKGYSEEEFYDKLSKQPLTSVQMWTMKFLEFFNISPYFLRHAKLNEEEIDTIIKYAYSYEHLNHLTAREKEITLIVSFALFAIVKEIHTLKDVANSVDDLTLKVKELEGVDGLKEQVEKQEDEISKLRRELDKAEKEKAKLKKDLKSSKKEVETLSTKLTNVTKSLKETKSETAKELKFLRSFYYDHTSKEEDESQLQFVESEDYYIKDLENVKGVIVGGHKNLRNKLKDKLPNFVTVDANNTTRDMSFIKNVDIVFLISVHNNHGMFYKIMPIINNHDTELSYLSKAQNVNLLLKEMHSRCEEYGVIK